MVKLYLNLQMSMIENGKLPLAGRRVLVVTLDGQEWVAVRIEGDLWQNLLITHMHGSAYGRFNTGEVYAWGYLNETQLVENGENNDR